MATAPARLTQLIEEAKTLDPIRVAVADAAQPVVIETLREAHDLGLIEPLLIGNPRSIEAICQEIGWMPGQSGILPAATDLAAAGLAVELAREGEADAVMKGHLHTDLLMRAALHSEAGLRVLGRRVSHVFLVETPTYPKLLGITDAAVNITPDLNAKAEILQNAVELFHLLGIDAPKVAVLSAVETVNPAITSTLDAACLALMARRGQITGATVDGPLAFDNAISRKAAEEKGIESPVAGDADILLVPDLVSGNILAKNLEYLAGATAAGIVVGLSVPMVLSSRADPAPARLAAIAVAVLMHHRRPVSSVRTVPEPSLSCAPQPEAACCAMHRSENIREGAFRGRRQQPMAVTEKDLRLRPLAGNET